MPEHISRTSAASAGSLTSALLRIDALAALLPQDCHAVKAEMGQTFQRAVFIRTAERRHIFHSVHSARAEFVKRVRTHDKLIDDVARQKP